MALRTGSFNQSGIVATGALRSQLGASPKKTFAIQCKGINASGVNTAPTALVVALQGTLNGIDFFTIGTWSIAGGQSNGDIVHVVDKPVVGYRANVTGLTLGSATSVEVNILASE